MTLLVENSGQNVKSSDPRTHADSIAWGLAWSAIILATPLHFLNLGLPLWLDEVWTGAIAGQSTASAVFQQTLYDVNAPLYYWVAYFCAKLFGLSNIGLRLPCAIFSAAAAFAALWLPSSLSKEAKLFWAALLALWIPGLDYSQDARCYALLFLLATINTAIFARLIVSPERRMAYLWAAFSLLMMFTHYHALLLVGVQGLFLLAWHKGKALALWPAALIFLPFPFWFACHLPTILLYLDPQTAWYWLLTADSLERIVSFFMNSDAAAAFAILMLLLTIWRYRPTLEAKQKLDPLWCVFFAGLIPAAAIIFMGFFRPSFTIRYLILFAPSILFGVALLSRATRSYWPLASSIFLLTFAYPTVIWVPQQINAPGKSYSFERASGALINNNVKSLIFFWDHPASKIVNPQQLDAVGAFFFKRAHALINVTSIAQERGKDPNPRLIEAAKKHDAVILWLFDRALPRTQARDYPVAIAKLDPSFECHNFGDGRNGIFACQRR